MNEGLLSKLRRFCDANDCSVEFNTETQVYEVIPIKKLFDIFEV